MAMKFDEAQRQQLTQPPTAGSLSSRATTSLATPPGAGHPLMDRLRQIGLGNTATAIQGAGQNIVESYQRGGLAAAAGATARNTLVPAIGFLDDLNTSARRLTDPVAQAVTTFATGDATPINGAPAARRLESNPAAVPIEQPPQPNSPASRDTQRLWQPPQDPAQASYDAFRGSMRTAMTEQLSPGETSGGTRPTPGLVERGNAGLRALATNPGLVERMNQQYQTDNIGVQASVDANGRMRFSDAPVDAGRPQTFRALSSGGNQSAAEIDSATDRLRTIGNRNRELRDQINFNRGGSLFRNKTTEEITRDMLTSPSRSDRRAALAYRGQQEALSSAERMGGPLFVQQVIAAQQARRVDELQRELVQTQDPARRREITSLLQSLGGGRPGNAQVVYGEEALDPSRPEMGTRRVPMVLNQDGSGTPVTARGPTRSLPNGVSREQAIAAARQAVQNGYDAAAVMARLGEYGLTFEDLQQ